MASASTPKDAPTVQTDALNWERNPLKNVWQGVLRYQFFGYGVFWFLLLFGILGMSSPGGGGGSDDSAMSGDFAGMTGLEIAAVASIVSLVAVAVIAVFIVIWGVMGYSAAKLAKDPKATVGLRESFNASLDNFGRLARVFIVLVVRVFLWSLLFLIPGFVMAFRYALSATIAFAEPELNARQVVSRSAQLTKGAWFDTFGTRVILSIITLGALDSLADASAQSRLYKQLKAWKESGAAKPATHWLSYLVFFIPAFTFMIILLIASIAYANADPATRDEFYNSSQMYL